MQSRSLNLLFLLLLVCVAAFPQNSRKYVTRPFHPGVDIAVPANAPASVPLWTGTADGYTYKMVGQSPVSALTTQTSTIGISIIPLILTFSDGNTFDSSVADPLCSSQGSASSLLQQSPIFNNYQYVSGTAWNTQYEDYFQRANFSHRCESELPPAARAQRAEPG
jgi:hypothetical protein